jgi:nucleotide-binding universal stress UspA family protein
MFNRLLVPLDETPRDEEALAVARGLARRTGATITLMHVEDPIVELPVVVGTNQYLERRIAELRADGVAARYFVEYGQPPREIGASAEQEQPDLIIMTPHHRDWLGTLRHPSVTVRMLPLAAVPVLVWPENVLARDVVGTFAVPGARILVPLDGSELAERAVPLATHLALAFERPLLLVRVVTPRTLVGGGPETARLELQTEGSALREARTYLGVMRKRLARETGLDVQSMVARGSPSHELLRIAGSHTGSVMVLSTHGRNGFARLLTGSVAADLVRETPIPVFVIPPRAWLEAPAEAMVAVVTEEPVVSEGG